MAARFEGARPLRRSPITIAAMAAPPFAAVFAAMGTVHAQHVDEDILVVSGRPSAISRTAAAVFVIEASEITDLAALRIGDVLASAPGTFLSGLNGPREIVQIRQPLAFDNRTLFLEDGVPLQSSIFFDQSALGYSIALASPGGVEVLRGPGTALYGSDALSGVVHVRSKAAPADFKAGLRARAGDFGLFDVAAEFGGPISSRQRLLVTGAVSGEDGFREETAFHRAQALARHEGRFGRAETDSGFAFTRYETESATAIPYSDFLEGSRESGLSVLVDPDAAVEEGLYARAHSRIAWRASESLRFEATPYLRRQEIRATATFQPATAPRSDVTVETVGLLPRLYWDHGDAAATVAGVDIELTWFERFTFQDAPDTVVFGDLFRQGAQFDYAVAFRGISPYVQHQQSFGPVTITLGLRYDRLRYDFDNALEEVPGDARLQSEDRIDRFDAFSPKAGLVWELSPTHSLFARYARGFRIPRESDLYELEEGQGTFALKPETLDSGEIGWRWRGRRASLELVGYWAVSRDGVITDVQTAAGNISVNAGSARYAGMEMAAGADLGAGLRADAVFAFQDFRFRRRAADGPDPLDGNLISEAPRTLGTLTVAWIPRFYERVRIAARLRHIGRWALNDANTFFNEDEYVLSLFAGWRATDRITLDLKVENAADAIYPVFADAPVFAPAGRARPGPPRTVSGGVRFAW